LSKVIANKRRWMNTGHTGQLDERECQKGCRSNRKIIEEG
jgi:hypothetical protein